MLGVSHLFKFMTSILAAAILFLVAPCEAQAPIKKTTLPSQAKPKVQLRIVAGVVGSDGTVRYLPRVDVRLMPSTFGEAESALTTEFNTRAERRRAELDDSLKALVGKRKAELAIEEDHYRRNLEEKLAVFHPSVVSLVPRCLTVSKISDREPESCRTTNTYTSIEYRIVPSDALREFVASKDIIGDFDPRTFTYNKSRVAGGLSFSGVRIEKLAVIPEFSKEATKILKSLKVANGQTVQDSVSYEAAGQLLAEWRKAATRRSYIGEQRSGLGKYSYLHPNDVSFLVKQIEISLTKERRALSNEILQRHIAAKDTINSRYDAEQASLDAAYRVELEQLEAERTKKLAEASAKFKPITTGQTSLQGDFSVSVPGGSYALYAEDTTTERRFRWMMPIKAAPSMATIELTDANALKGPAVAFASASTSAAYPMARELTEDERAEYDLRYGHRILKSWAHAAILHDVTANSEELYVEDTPLGFGFHVLGTSTVVFNNLRVSDNDVASRFFKEVVSNFLKEVPDDLKNTGGLKAFEAVSISVIGSSKSFAEEYAIGIPFTITYTFKVSDVESFALDKIDSQQLLDRGQIKDSRTGRVKVLLTSAH
jgi:hypothetical protein